MDARLLKAARQAYDVHCEHRSDLATLAPEGVAIDRRTLRCDVLYSEQPALLPGECFIAFSELKAAVFPELSAWP